jgi:hypothetical protein
MEQSWTLRELEKKEVAIRAGFKTVHVHPESSRSGAGGYQEWCKVNLRDTLSNKEWNENVPADDAISNCQHWEHEESRARKRGSAQIGTPSKFGLLDKRNIQQSKCKNIKEECKLGPLLYIKPEEHVVLVLKPTDSKQSLPLGQGLSRSISHKTEWLW